MPSVKNNTDAPSPDSSNVVLFQMMMHYKQEADHFAIKMKEQEEAFTKERRELLAYGEFHHVRAIDAENALHNAQDNIRLLEDANRRGAAIIMQKHHAGMLMADAFDGIMSNIELAVFGDQSTGRNNCDVKYIKEQAETHRTIFNVAMSRFTTGWFAPSDEEEDELMTDEVIDLTGEETEEEDDDVEV